MFKTLLRKIGLWPKEDALVSRYAAVEFDDHGLPRDMKVPKKDGHRPLKLEGCLAPTKPTVPSFISGLEITNLRYEVYFLVMDYLKNKHLWRNVTGRGSIDSPHFCRDNSKLSFSVYESYDGKVTVYIKVTGFDKIELIPEETKALWTIARDCRARTDFNRKWLSHEALIYELNKIGEHPAILNYQYTVKPVAPTKEEVFSDTPSF